MLSQTFCYWDKQQSADSNIIQYPSHTEMHQRSLFPFLWLFFSFEMNFSTPRLRSGYKFYAGSEQPLVCVVINNSSYPTVKNNNTAYHAFRKYWMQATGLLNYRLKYCWPKVIYCICQPNELEREITQKTGAEQANIWGDMAHPGPP